MDRKEPEVARDASRETLGAFAYSINNFRNVNGVPIGSL
jgi:hypothetical protein